MSNLSNDQGRAYEYICLLTLEKEICKYRNAKVITNSSFSAAEHAWNNMDNAMQRLLARSAEAAVYTIFDMEPLILEDGNDPLELMIQPDTKGEEGDVRDILVIRRNIQWEIGLSIKHNSFAVKHSRLAKNLDFGEKWFGIPCSKEYWQAIKPVFTFLEEEKKNGTNWRDLASKEQDVYLPIMTAFADEIRRSYNKNQSVPKKMVEYLLGQFDFYKVISIDNRKITQIQTYNLRGTLNKPSKAKQAKIRVPIANLPTRIVSLAFKPGSRSTVELYLDGGWQFSFRIHNASTKVEPSLKLDVQIIGMPTAIISINCSWNDEKIPALPPAKVTPNPDKKKQVSSILQNATKPTPRPTPTPSKTVSSANTPIAPVNPTPPPPVDKKSTFVMPECSVGDIVISTARGAGVITAIDPETAKFRFITVKFPDAESKFQIPQAFLQSFLKLQ